MNSLLVSAVLLVCISIGGFNAQSPTPSPDFKCPNDNPEGGMYPHPTDCTKYYECANGLAWELQCPADLVFNPAIGGCDYPTGADCRNPTTQPVVTSTTATPTPTTPEQQSTTSARTM